MERRFLEALREGNYIETAAATAGIARKTVYDRLRSGARGQRPEDVAFLHRVDGALAFAESRDLATIKKASEADWKAAAWRLERRFPQRWGKIETVVAKLLANQSGIIENVPGSLGDREGDESSAVAGDPAAEELTALPPHTPAV